MKKMVSMVWGSIVVLLLILMLQECLAGVTIEQVMRDGEGNASKVFITFSENKFRTDHPEGGMTTIIDFQGDRMVMIDHRSKQYVEIRFSQWEKEVSERLKKSAPGTKAKSRKILVKRTGETAILNGFQTEKV
jgi:hypothetical protein